MQLLPELPRLLHQALQPRAAHEQRVLELLREQRRSQRRLRGALLAALGFAAGVVTVELMRRGMLW